LTRTIATASHGRFVAIRRGGRLAIVDALGTAAEQSMAWTGRDLAFVGDLLWLTGDGGLRCVSPVDLAEVACAAFEGDEIVGVRGRAAACAVIGQGGRWSLATLQGGELEARELALDEGLAPLGGHQASVLVAGDGRVAMVEDGRIAWQASIPPGEVLGGAVLFDGRAVAVHVRPAGGAGDDVQTVLRRGGERIHAIPVPASDAVAFAPGRGIAVVAAGDALHRVDLRFGRMLGAAAMPLPAVELLLDDDGRFLVAAGPAGASERAEVLHILLSDLFLPPSARASQAERAPDGNGVRSPGSGAPGATSTAAADAPAAPSPATPSLATPVAPPAAESGPARPGVIADSIADRMPDGATEPADAAEGDIAEPPPPEIVIPDRLPLAFGAPPAPQARRAPDGGDAFFTPREHLDALLDLVAARTALAIADAWNSGRLSGPGADARPFEREVNALLGDRGGFAPDRLAEGVQRLSELTARTGQRARASIAAGMRLPFVDLTREFKLSSVAAQILLTVMAPALRGEIARLFSVLANDPNRPLCDRHLVELVVAGDSSDVRDQVAHELSLDASLVRHGLVRVGEAADATLFAPITVDDVLLERVRGHRAGGLDEVGSRRVATARLEELHVPRAVLRDLVLALAEPCPPGAPLRLVLRGRRGSGRHTIVAALAARVGRDLVAIDCARLPRAPRVYASALRTELFRALIRDVIPVLSELDLVDPTDGEVRDAVRQVLRMHPGPLVVRTSPEAILPMDPGHLDVVLPSLSEGERAAAWQDALDRHQLAGADADRLASRYRLGPGEVVKVVAQVARRSANGAGGDVRARVDEAARQHVSARLDHVATHIARLAAWDQVALPDDMLDSLREFVGRARHRRTVYERWGYDRTMTTSRGLTALFYGPPGTGKSMVAGVIASELGLDLYRVDLARVVSKWVGETEKNLSEVFDAAEDGQVLILFDEADSLFSKRTDVRTANDRYANLEVNYLLQRLDTFEGIAVLTSNLEGSIDQAFKRRLSLRLYFPFPDEEMRARLWAGHVPPRTPVAGQFDFMDLARRFPLSGGYIRNCTLRAAFLAAQEQRPMTQDHLLRAIHLEYRELGKLSTTSRME